MVRRFIHLSIALLLALLAHALVLWGINRQVGAMHGGAAPQVGPLFARQITQAQAPALPETTVLLKKQAVDTKDVAQPAIKNAAYKPLDTLPPEAIASVPTPTATLSASLGPTTDTLAMQGAWPIDTRLTYELAGYHRSALLGTATLQWTRETTPAAEGYQVQIDLEAVGFTAQLSSQGRMSDKGLQPQTYTEQWLGLPRSVALDVADVVLVNGQRIARPQRDGALPEGSEGVQDAASQFVALGHRFATGLARLAEGEVVRVWLARPGGLQVWDYDVRPMESVTLPQIGTVQAYPLVPRPQASAPGALRAEIWFAPALQYLPVRIKLTLDNEVQLDLTVQKIEQR